ncbi:MAG: hypothetical protein HFF50_05370 [Lawsonibacter sp.]|nr:hypothetical protein [Lawsonibacter sp.]
MGLFGFGKKKAEPFSFRIDDIFRIKGHGVVVTGQVTAGTVRAGDQVTCVTTDGQRFPCTIQQIEQPSKTPKEFVQPDRASADGPFGGSYAFWVGDRDPRDFHPGDRLISGNE